MGSVERRLTDQIANFAFIEWEENIAVSDNSPKKYAPALSSCFDKSDLEKFSYWHALPEGWVDMEYGEFLQARRPLIAKVIKDGFARWPQLEMRREGGQSSLTTRRQVWLVRKQRGTQVGLAGVGVRWVS